VGPKTTGKILQIHQTKKIPLFPLSTLLPNHPNFFGMLGKKIKGVWGGGGRVGGGDGGGPQGDPLPLQHPTPTLFFDFQLGPPGLVLMGNNKFRGFFFQGGRGGGHVLGGGWGGGVVSGVGGHGARGWGCKIISNNLS